MLLTLALLIALQTPDATRLPSLRMDGSGGLIVDTPGVGSTPTVFRVTLDLQKMDGGSIEDHLAVLLDAEPFDLVSYDPELGHAEIRSSEWGGFALTRALNRRAGILTSVAPRVESIQQDRCISILATLPADNTPATSGEVFGPKLCPPARRVTPGEQLIVVGLNMEGKPLWTAVGANSRFYRFEDLGAAGGVVETGEHTEGPYVTSLVAPDIDGLSRLRWFAVGPKGTLEQIGESDWAAPTGVPAAGDPAEE